MYAYDYDANKWMEGFSQKEWFEGKGNEVVFAKFCLVFANLNANEIETFLWLYFWVLFLAEILGDKYWILVWM